MYILMLSLWLFLSEGEVIVTLHIKRHGIQLSNAVILHCYTNTQTIRECNYLWTVRINSLSVQSTDNEGATQHTQREDSHWLRVPRGPSYNRCFIYLAMSCDLGYVAYVMCVYTSLKVYLQIYTNQCNYMYVHIVYCSILKCNIFTCSNQFNTRTVSFVTNVNVFKCLLVICFELIWCSVITFVHACIP